MDASDVVAALGLTPHPEGGFYRQTWADASGTAIYYLLPGPDWAAWHRVLERVEIWHWYAGAPLRLSLDPSGPGTPGATSLDLGADLARGQRPQAVVGAGVWQRARCLGDWTLAGCTVTPPFTFEAFEIAAG